MTFVSLSRMPAQLSNRAAHQDFSADLQMKFGLPLK
jgi:hypothetical protein